MISLHTTTHTFIEPQPIQSLSSPASARQIEGSLYGSEADDRFLVIVDGEQVNDFKAKATTWSTDSLASGLKANANHTLVLWKATEDNTQKKAKGAASVGEGVLRDPALSHIPCFALAQRSPFRAHALTRIHAHTHPVRRVQPAGGWQLLRRRGAPEQKDPFHW